MESSITGGAAEKAEKVRENRLRRMADRQGLRIVKSRRRDPRATDYGGYMIVNQRNVVQAGDLSRGGMTIDQVEAYLTGES